MRRAGAVRERREVRCPGCEILRCAQNDKLLGLDVLTVSGKVFVLHFADPLGSEDAAVGGDAPLALACYGEEVVDCTGAAFFDGRISPC